MNYIVLDIEFNGRKFASDLPMEVIEIGAVRLDDSLNIVDEFQAVIKPVYFSKLNTFIKKKTGISQEEIDSAAGFKKVIADFINWLKQSEPFLLFTWGGEDLKRIVLDTRMHKLDDSFWLQAEYFDLLKGYIRYRNVSNDVSVETALQELGIDAEGSAHRALDDARMTAYILRAIIDKIDLERKQHYKDQYTNAKERRMIKNAIRSLTVQKLTPSWELLFEKYFAGKEPPVDPKKLEEMKSYCEAEIIKAKLRKTAAPAASSAPAAVSPASEKIHSG